MTRYFKKKDQKVLVAEKSKRKQEDSYSDLASSETSSNESEEEQVQCLKASVELKTADVELDTTDDMVFDFRSSEFT